MIPADETGPAAAAAFAAGEVVLLRNVRSGLAVVGIDCDGRRVHTPNPTRARVLGGPRLLANGTEVYDVLILDGPHRGRRASCHPDVVHRAIAPAPRRRWGWRGLLGS
jgi:hypothetical protein